MHRFLGKDPNGLAQGDFAEIARLLPEVYRAAAGRWMPQPQVQPQAQPQVQPQPQPQSQAQPQPAVNPAQQNMQTPNAQPSDLGVQPSQGLTAQNPQQPQVQAVPSAEDLTDIRQKLAALDTMMQGNPAYVEARRRGDWQTAAREAEKAGHHDLARVYQMLHEKMTGAPLNVTPYQNPAAKAGDEQGAARPTPAPVPVHPVDSLHPVDIPKSVGARRDFGRGLIKAMRMRNIPIVDTLKEGLRDGKKDALKHALKRIAQADEEDAILRGETAAQRANDGDEAQAEPREKQGDEVQAKSAQNEGKENSDGHMEWIAAHPFRYDDAKSVEENIRDAEALAQEYLDAFGTTDQINTPERQELRRKIADELYGEGAAKKEGKVWLVLGVPASGKSTFSDPLVEKEGALLIDSDEAKKLLPEFSNGLLAGAVHEESAAIAEDVSARAAANHDNMVLPLVGKSISKLQEKIDKFKEAGYQVNLIYVDLPIEKAIERTKARFRETGRLVSPSYLGKVGLKPKENYDKLKMTEGVDSYEAWNSDVERGSSPRNIERSARPEQETSPHRMGGRGQHARQLDESDGLRDSSEESRRSTLNTANRSDNQGGFSTPKKSVQAKSAPLTKQEQEALTGTSEEAKEAYRIVRDKLAKSKNKAVVRAAKVGATLFARHADIYAKAYSKATGKPYTALDYLHDKFGLDADGKEADGRADGLGQAAMKRSSAGSLAVFSRQMRNPVEGSGSRNKQFLRMTASSGAVVDVAQDDMLHMHKRHPEMTDADFSVIQENMENFLRVHQDKTEKGDYGGETILCKIKTPRGIAGVSYEFLPTGRIFLKTAFFDHENGIDSWIEKNGTSKDLMDSGITKRGNAASMLTGHPSQTDKTADSPTLSDIQPLSLSMIQERIGIVNGASLDQRAWHGTPYYFKYFDLGAIGTGEGAQVHGWGLYFAEAKGTAMGYRSTLSEAVGYIVDYYGDRYYKTNEGWLFNEEGDEYGEHSDFLDYTDPMTKALDAFHEYGDAEAAIKSLEKELEETSEYASESEIEQIKGAIEILQNDGSNMELKDPGTLFEVEIPDNDVLLDEQKPFDEQPEKVQEALGQIAEEVASQGEGSPGASFAERYQEMDGREIYEALADITGSPEDASALLNKHGVEGITYNGRQDGRCFVVFDDKAIEIINKFNQRMNDIRKGSITPQASGRRVISLFEKADESTFLHEMGHMFLMDLEDVAALDEASAEDLETVRDWAAWQEGQAEEYEDTPWQKEFAEREKAILQAKKSGDAVSVRKLKREWEQERFARGFERYLETGKAPTSVLQRIFQTFKKFLKRIYQAFKGTGGKASPEVEAVMGRMIAEDAERASGESEESPVQAKSAPIQADFSSSKIKGWTGKTTAIVTDSGEEIPVRYRLVEAESLVTSNNAKTFLKNPAYPKSLQPRDRERANMQQQIVEMTSRLRPEDLAESRSANLGAPVVRADGVVLNGNGRAIAITRALLGNTFRDSAGAGYRAFLKEHAKEFGFKPKAVSKMRAPMLVREITAGLTKEQVEAVTTSTTGGSRLGASEQAKQDAEKITLEDLSRYEENERGDLTTAANRGFVSGILYHVSGKNDVNAYTDAKGQVNADGIQRVKRALFQKAYGDDHLLSRMSESTDDDTRNITNGLTIAAPYIARANEKMARGTAHGYKIGETIADAVKRYNHLHDIGQSVEGYLDQQAMFAEHEDSPEMREVLRVLNENRRSGKRIAQFVRRVGEIAEEQGNPNEISLMEGGEPLPLHDVIRSAKEDLQEALGQQSLNTLFQEAPALKDAALEYGATEKDGEVTFENPGREKEFLRIAEALQGDVAKKLSAGKSVNDESVSIEKGERAVRQVLNSKRDVPNAMYREEIGGIDFLYGKAGDPARKFAGGYGIAHILAKHGQEAVDMIPMVIARGKMSQKYRDRVYFSLDNYMATVRLDFDGQKRTWLVTNFEKYANKKDSPATEDFTRSAANPDGASSTAGGNLSLASTISSKEAEDKGSLKNELQEENFSARRQEALSKVLKEIKLIAPEKLSKKQSGIADFGKAMGMPVVFFKGVTNLHGFHANGVTFLNMESETSLSWTFWHEALHWMKANNEELFGEIIEDVEKAGAFTKAQLDGYREEIGAPELSDAEAIEEMLADALPDVKRRVPFMKNLGKRNKSLAERFVGWIREVMDRFRDFFHTPARGLTKAQSAAMRDAFAALARDMVDERGRRIFRVDGVGRRITLANGAPLPSTKYSLDNREGRGDNEDRISKAVFDKHLNDGIMKMVEERVRKEIGEHVDFAAMSDPVARDAARDGLPYIKKMLVQYNIIKAQKMNPAYADRYAVMIEYARRCFDNDSRVGREATRGLGQNDGQGRMDSTGNENHAEPNVGRSAERGGRSTLGLSRSVSGEKSGARAHFERLYEDMKKHPETGAFSMVKFSRNNSKPGSTGLFRRLLVGLKIGEEAAENLEVHRSNKEKQLVIPASKLNKFMVDKALTEKNILKTEDVGNGNIRVTYMPQDFRNIKAMRMRNIPVVDTLKEGLRDGRKDALKHALKRIAQVDEKMAYFSAVARFCFATKKKSQNFPRCPLWWEKSRDSSWSWMP
mgnify:CR=1 FL=1